MYKYYPAHSEDKIVFGAERPGYSSSIVKIGKVKEWIKYMKEKGILKVVCLLDEKQLAYYGSLSSGLLGEYSDSFGQGHVLHAPIKDLHLSSPENLSKILKFLRASDSDNEPVVVHCSGGVGRTGHVLAAWLVYGRSFEVEDAIREVSIKRNPCEAVECGNATREELIQLLSAVKGN